LEAAPTNQTGPYRVGEVFAKVHLVVQLEAADLAYQVDRDAEHPEEGHIVQKVGVVPYRDLMLVQARIRSQVCLRWEVGLVQEARLELALHKVHLVEESRDPSVNYQIEEHQTLVALDLAEETRCDQVAGGGCYS